MNIDYDKLVAALPAFIKGFAVSEPVPVPDPTPDPKPGKKMADFATALYNSANVVKDANGAVTKLKAVKGGPDLDYIGIPNPTLGRPFIVNGEVMFLNQQKANFKKQIRSNGDHYPFPEEMTLIIRRLPGTEWETLLNSWGDPYIGFGGLTELRALNNGLYFSQPAPFKYFELAALHLRYDAVGQDCKCTAWVNGKLIGSVTSQNGDFNERLGYGVGSETNSADYAWAATAYIERGLTDAERADYFAAINAEYAIGSVPDLPYASEVSAMNTGTKLLPVYRYNGSVPEDKSKVQYRWYKMNPDLTNQQLIGTGSSVAAQKGVKLCVQVADVQGHTWTFVSGKYN